jgi:predicted MFS family arabinose efflux permease
LNLPVGIALVVLTPRYLAESRVGDALRHFDIAGASTITGSLMVLVYGLTRATQDGWGSDTTVTLMLAAAALFASFIAIERRAASPLVPFHVFRGNTLAVGALITCVIASIAFSQFFLLTLYLQQVLHYSAAQSGAAFVAIAGTVAITSNIAQRLVTRFGFRRVLAAGLASAALSQLWLVRLPTHGHYVTDLLPSFILIGVGMGLSFVSVTIASLAGVPQQSAGIASGLVNTSRQVGGAVGLAAITTIASLAANGSTLAATVHGYHVSFAVLAGLAVIGVASTPFLRAHQPSAEPQTREDLVPAQEAA